MQMPIPLDYARPSSDGRSRKWVWVTIMFVAISLELTSTLAIILLAVASVRYRGAESYEWFALLFFGIPSLFVQIVLLLPLCAGASSALAKEKGTIASVARRSPMVIVIASIVATSAIFIGHFWRGSQ